MVIRAHIQRLVERARLLSALPAAFVYPCDAESLQLALSTAFAGYMAPVLVGPEARIRDTASKAGVALSSLPILDTPDDPRLAGVFAAQIARAGTVGALVKGSLGNEDLLGPVAAPESGLRGERRLSHVYFLDLSQQPRGLLLADAQINIAPNLAAKKDIVLNSLQLAAAIGIEAPKLALLAAMEVVNPAFAATADAVALKTMALRGLFPGALIDGPLGVDSALSAEAARANGRESPVAGAADVMIAPGMESAWLVLRSLIVLTGGLAAGLVLGATVPIVAPARTDAFESRLASCVLAALLAGHEAELKRQRSGSEMQSANETLAVVR